MLPPAHRLTDSATFREVTRRGRRAGSATLVAHLLVSSVDDGGSTPSQVGFVVSKAVGNSVVRHAVQRKLRHQARAHVDRLSPGSRLVVRALAEAATSSSARLGADLSDCLARLPGALPGSLPGAGGRS